MRAEPCAVRTGRATRPFVPAPVVLAFALALAFGAAPRVRCLAQADGAGERAGAQAPAAPERSGAAPRGRRANRLLREKSPYLLQHAYNPVDWYPWGDEAFAAARESGRPTFLSIGYSTCHWCHVMEHESFENEELAAYLNQYFISIKVDREERPDIDEVYMNALVRTQGRGGWPLSAFLTAEGKPFYLGSYFPPDVFKTLLEKIVEVWNGEQKPDLLSYADQVAAHLRGLAGPRPAAEPWGRAEIDAGFAAIAESFDPVHGGFDGPPAHAPKFPRPSNLEFLLAYHHRTGEARALEMALHTLERMAAGGVRDQLGDGFHRYSVDREWLVPHFEKMLYDNASLAGAYVDAYRITGRESFLDVARSCLAYLRGRMAHPAGGYYSAEDADSEGAEGKYYVFGRAETIELLGPEVGELVADHFGMVPAGNFEDTGKNVLHLALPVDALAAREGKDAAAIARTLEAAREKLLAARSRRVPPLRDDKILTDWNGLAVSALARAYGATGRREFFEDAERTVDFLSRELVRDGLLLHRYRDGEARHPGYLEDYACLATGFLDLYEASLETDHLASAARLAAQMIEKFWDPEAGGFYQSGADHESLIVRSKDFYDGAIPSGNSIAACLLQRLADYTGDERFRVPLAALARLAVTLVGEDPRAYPQLLLAAARSTAPRLDVVVVGERRAAAALVRAAQRPFALRRTLARLDNLPAGEAPRRWIPWLATLGDPAEREGRTTGAAVADPYALVRRGSGAFRRVSSPEELAALFAEGGGGNGEGKRNP